MNKKDYDITETIYLQKKLHLFCPECDKVDTCDHANAFRRLPKDWGGLGLCPNLSKEKNK